MSGIGKATLGTAIWVGGVTSMQISFIQVAARAAVIGLGLFTLGCTTTDSGEGEQSISIPYDPYNFDPADLQAEADAHCSAYGLVAVYDDETVDTQSVRWRYRHYRCL